MGDDSKNAPPTLEELTQEVKELKIQVDNEAKGFTGWIKWLGLILAFVAAIFAVPKGAMDVWEAFFTRPNTQVTPESNLTMSYDPKNKNVQFDFAFTISNDGKRHDIVQSALAHLEQIDQRPPAPLITFNDNDFSFTENNVKISNRFSINKETTRAVACQMNAYVSEQNREYLLQPRSRWRLTIELTGEYGKLHSLRYCFDVSKMLRDEIVNSQQIIPIPFLEAQCDEDS